MSERAPQNQDKFIVRLPDGMRDRIKKVAEANNRSMNAEIVATLETHYPPPRDEYTISELFSALRRKATERHSGDDADLETSLRKIDEMEGVFSMVAAEEDTELDAGSADRLVDLLIEHGLMSTTRPSDVETDQETRDVRFKMSPPTLDETGNK